MKYEDLKAALVAARLPDLPSKAELDKLLTALDAWVSREDQTVNFNKILSGGAARSAQSIGGIFPKVQAKELGKYEQERRAKAAEEERKAQEQAEQERKQLEETRTRKLAGQAGRGGTSAKEEQMLLEIEKKEAERQRQERERAIQAEINAVRTCIVGIREKARRQAGSVRAWFRLFDTDKSRTLDQKELTGVLQHAGLRLPDKDVAKLISLLDQNGDGQVSAPELCSVLEGKDVPDSKLRTFAEKQIEKAKADADEVLKRDAEAANIRSSGADRATYGATSRDAGVEGVDLKSIAGRSNYDEK